MNSFKLVQHKVTASTFIENKEKEKKNDIEVSVEGSVLIPKDTQKTKYLAVQLKLKMGQPEERLNLTMETVSTFEIERISEEISEDIVRMKCFPIALSELRKTVRNVTEAYGMSPIDLPPFEEEMENEMEDR